MPKGTVNVSKIQLKVSNLNKLTGNGFRQSEHKLLVPYKKGRSTVSLKSSSAKLNRCALLKLI